MPKWQELRSALKAKLQVDFQPGTKHDFWFVVHDGHPVARLKDVHGKGEMEPWEIGNVARSMALNEKQLRLFAACPMTGEECLARILERGPGRAR